MLYCIVLYCLVLYCIVLYCLVLYCMVLYCRNQYLFRVPCSLPTCRIATQPHSRTATQPHSHTAIQPHSHMPHSHTATCRTTHTAHTAAQSPQPPSAHTAAHSGESFFFPRKMANKWGRGGKRPRAFKCMFYSLLFGMSFFVRIEVKWQNHASYNENVTR